MALRHMTKVHCQGTQRRSVWLHLVGALLQVWMLVQRKWMYLESIFIGSDDIRNQLPQEAKRFDGIDKAWLKIMSDTARNTNVLEACSVDGR